MNRAKFFAAIRAGLLGPKLDDGEVSGCTAILDAFANEPIDQTAYALATAYHETGGTMRPVVENLYYSTAARIRQVWPSRFPTLLSATAYIGQPKALANKVYGGRNGNTAKDDGWDYRGRGLAQLTGRANYKRLGELLDLPQLETTPDLASDLAISAKILHVGMTRGEFTGKKLRQYLPLSGLPDPVGARKIINPDRNGALVAGYYKEFKAALQ